MSKINWVLLAGVLCFSSCSVAPYPPPHPGSAVVQSGPPPDRAEIIPPAPSSDDFWIKGYWQWENGVQVWVPGRWEAKRPGWHWVPAHWDMPGERWEFVAGYWQPN
jgi:hypothetical protein